MAHIDLNNDYPGIRGLMAYRPETSGPLNDLAEVLLRSENSLTPGERELIATFVSAKNDCFFCQNSHGGYAQYFLDCSMELVDQVKKDYLSSNIPEKLKALLTIAGSVALGGKFVTAEQVQKAKDLGATDLEIHDTVLIAAAFCMFNRYVDGLGTTAPDDRQYYINRAAKRVHLGYKNYDPAT